MSIWVEAGDVISSFTTLDPWEMRQAFNMNGAWLVFTVLTALGAFLTLALYRAVPWIDRNLERSIIVYTYLLIAIIIFAGVIQRFVLYGQPPWSTTIPPMLFMIMAWYGCSYNVRLRTHLAFGEFRSTMPRNLQMACLVLDFILWFGFCVIIVTTTARMTVNSADNFQIVLGTDNIKQWWFVVTIPIAFTLMAGRVLENLLEDVRNYRSGKPLIEQAVIGADV
jgi:TRAP-type C4-dicarboxylate transport system permease small subunit